MKQLNISEGGRHRDPFKAPEGYFDTLAGKVMQRIENNAAEAARTTLVRTRRVSLAWRCAAAASVALVVGIGVMHYSTLHPDDYDARAMNQIDYLTNVADDDEWDEAIDCTVLNNQDMVYYLTEAF